MAVSVALSGIVALACGGATGEAPAAAAPAAAPVQLAGGGSCAAAELATTVEATLESGKGGGARLRVKVCTRCGEAPIGGVTGITGQVAEPVKGLAPAFRKPATFAAAGAKGCTTKTFKKAPGKLLGKRYKVTLVGPEGTIAAEREAVITKAQ